MKKAIFCSAFFADLFGGLAAASYVAALLVPYAHRWRGYRAVGGEWLLILLAGAVGCWLVHQALIKIIGKELAK